MTQKIKDVVRMYRSIRIWNTGLIVWGTLSFLIGTFSFYKGQAILDPIWGFELAITAVLLRKIKVPAIYILYLVIVGWVAVINIISAVSGMPEIWLMILFQVFIAALLVLQIREYRKLRLGNLYRSGIWPKHLSPPQNEAIVSAKFSNISAILSVIALAISGLGYIFISNSLEPIQSSLTSISLIILFITDLAALAFGFGCAGLYPKNDKKRFAISGIVMSGVVLVSFVSMEIAGLLSGVNLDM